MKRFYSLLLIGAALLSGSVYGMQKEADVRDYADVMEHLTTTAHFRADDEFENLATTLPAIEEFILMNNKQDEKQYARLCASYLNKKFALSECDPQQVEMMFMECFFGDSPLAEFYLMHRQEIVGQLNLDKLDAIMKKAAVSKDIDTLLQWLPIFDETGHAYEQLFADALSEEINKRGLTNGMQPWERNVLQKAGHLQGLCEKVIDPLHQKEQVDNDQRKQLRDNAANRRDQMVGQIFNALKANVLLGQKEQFDKLIQDELIGSDAPLGGHLDYINRQIERRINNPKVKVNKSEELLKAWKDTFCFVQEQSEAEDNRIWNGAAQTDNKRRKDQREQQEQLNQRLEQIRINGQRQIDEEQRRQAEEQRHRQLEEQSRNRDEQQRQYEEQKRIQREQRNPQQPQQPQQVQQPQQPTVNQPQQPNIGGQPDFAKATTGRPDNPEVSSGVAALFASIDAPKLMAAAVVVGVCYWGYTKYKAAQKPVADDKQESASVKTTADKNKDQVVRNTQTTQKKKESTRNNRRVR